MVFGNLAYRSGIPPPGFFSSKKPAAKSAILPAILINSAAPSFWPPTASFMKKWAPSPAKSLNGIPPGRFQGESTISRAFAALESRSADLFRATPRVQLCNRRPDREAPRVDREILEFLWHDVTVLRFFDWDSGLVHFFCLSHDVVEHFANRGNSFLPANLSVAGHEQRVFIERRKFLQRIAPARNCSLLVEAHGIPSAEKQISGVNHVLLGHFHNHVRPRMPRMRLHHRRQPAQIHRHRKFCRIDRMIW